jgi:hypothetical protein
MEQMSRRRSIRAVVAVAVAVAVAGCGVADGEGDDTIPPVTPVPTIAGVGAVPAVPVAVREPVVVVRPPVNQDGTEAQLIGEKVDGNRILMIGDSILTSTSSRYGNHMCNAVVPLGWQVAVEAEPSRFIDFGNSVLDKVLIDDPAPAEDWDAAVVFLGSNYRGDADEYERELVEILDRLEPRPVVLFTVTEYRPNYVEVNEIVTRLGSERDNVTVLDWAAISASPGVLSGDGLHPTDTGRRVIAESVAAALGPVEGIGDCLRSSFRDDSRVGGDSTTVLGRRSSGTSTSGSTSPSTTASPPASTVPGGGDDDGDGGVSSTTVPSTGVTTSVAPNPTNPTNPTIATTTAPAGLVEPTP